MANHNKLENLSQPAHKPRSYSKKHRITILLLTLLVILMFGFGYALVPIYNTLCQALGLNGKTGGPTAQSNLVDESRWVTVQFLATNNANLPWKFYPVTTKIKIHPGENTKVAYFAENDSSKNMTVQAVPSVTPGLAAKFLKKTECFCFNRQTLKSKESMEMPLIFHLDTHLPKQYNTVTLAYTLFDVTNIKTKASPARVGKIVN